MNYRERAYEWLTSEHCNAIRVEDFPAAVESLIAMLETVNEEGDPPTGSRLWRCEQELAKARSQLQTIRHWVTEAPFPKGMYLIDKGHVDGLAVDNRSCSRCQGSGHVMVENAGGYFRKDPCGCGATHPIGTAQESE